MVELNDYVTARRYLAPPRGSFWQWLDDGQVAAWNDGQTIAFRAEVEPILARLAPAGLPPLGAVLLLIAATRDNWTHSAATFRNAAGAVVKQFPGETPVWLPEIFVGLNTVSGLDHELRSSVEARCELADLLFEGSRDRGTSQEAAAVLRALAFGPPEMLLPRDPPLQAVEELRRDLFALREGLKRVDAGVLTLRRRTGLERLPEPAPIELPPGERTRQLLSQLESDEELSGLARLARNLMAAVYLPRSMSDREDLPLGGVSDISNRGSLDRLLLSELAYDDLTLATRIAVNEAMYLRREAPPRTPPARRALLLDAGLRTWGVPRVYATAVALALAANADRHTAVDAWRAHGERLEPVDLCGRAGLVAHLAALDTAVHPGAALAAFATELDAHDEAVDAVLITHEDAAADPQFVAHLSASSLATLHVATINRQGDFRLTLHSGRGSRLLRSARLSLDELLAPRGKPVAPLIDPNMPTGLPAILAIKPLPLLLPRLIDPQRTCHVPGQGVLQVTRDRRLLLWNNPDRGARQLADDLPSPDIEWLPPLGGFAPVLGVLRSRPPRLIEVDMAGQSVRSLPLELDEGEHHDFAFHGGALLAIAQRTPMPVSAVETMFGRQVKAVETMFGRQVQTHTLPPGAMVCSGRYFYHAGVWFAIAFDGIALHVEKVFQRSGDFNSFLDRVVEVSGYDGATGISVFGHLVHLAETGQVIQVPHTISARVRVLAMARDGSRFIVAPNPQSKSEAGVMWLVNTVTGDAKQVQGDPQRLVEPGIGQYARPHDVQHRFVRAYAHELGLALVSRRGQPWLIYHHESAGRLRMGRIHTDRPQLPSDQVFVETAAPAGVGYKLRVATWPDGSRAFLDSRGMLHLKSSDPSVPELSVVLAEGELAGWCANGGLWGRAYFTGEANGMSAGDVYDKALKPFVERLRL